MILLAALAAAVAVAKCRTMPLLFSIGFPSVPCMINSDVPTYRNNDIVRSVSLCFQYMIFSIWCTAAGDRKLTTLGAETTRLTAVQPFGTGE